MRLYLGKGTLVRKYVLWVGLFTLLGSPSTQAGSSFTGLSDLAGGSFESYANGVSADGSVAVGLGSSTSGNEAFRWTDGGGMVGLGDLAGGSFYSDADGVSADGSVAVGRSISASGSEAFRWTDGGGMVGLGDLAGGSFNSRAYSVSADGSTVVGRGSSASGTEAFVWDETNGMRGLMQVLMDQGIDMTGWSLTEARGVSADGLTIVGYGTNPLGQEEGWIATIVPEPSTALLLGLGLSALAATRRR